MVKYFFSYNALKPISYFKRSILLILFALVGCKSIDVKEQPDLLPYMLKPVALLPTKSPRNLESVWPSLMYKMEEYLRQMPALGRIKGVKELNKKLDAKEIHF